MKSMTHPANVCVVLPPATVECIDALRGQRRHERPGASEVTRSEVIRELIARGLAALAVT